jgi:hypothetical protein
MPSQNELLRRAYDERLKSISVAKVEEDFDVLSLTTETTYAFDRDSEGNLWFAKTRKKKRYADANIGAEVVRFDGERATRWILEGDVAGGDDLSHHHHFARDARGTAWWFWRVGKEDRPLLALREDGTLPKWGDHPARDEIVIDGKRRRLDEIKQRDLYAVVDVKSGRALRKFKPEVSDTVHAGARRFYFTNGYNLEVRGADGKQELLLKQRDLPRKESNYDFNAPTEIDDTTLLVPFHDRHGRGAYLYTLDLTTRALRPHPWNGLLKAQSDRCFFDKKGRLWLSHLHSPAAGFWTTFTVIDGGGVARIDDGFPGKKKEPAKTQAAERKETKRIAIALKALDRHAKAYGVPIPAAVRAFVKQGKLFELEGRSVVGNEESFQVRAVRPTWLDQEGLDDAVVGPKGDWSAAGRYLPLFELGDCRFIVVDMKDKALSVGLFHEEEVGGRGNAWKPDRLAKSLADLAKKLKKVEDPTEPLDFEDDGIWAR